ncbi:tetratricopeptide repeat protein [Parashewanella tropica]|uniref:tetratricopeptide repeat protein n=1 Tax=Parashewanella tropica TaxID=2547970 RepID=UPI001478F2D9|nr:tetratricopeptide repeat protein [Parashewanella tropica]
MSVINKMLKDLEQRQQPHDLSNVSRVQVTETEDNSWKKAIIILLSLILVLVTAACGYWVYSNQQSNLEVQPSKEVSIAKAPLKTPLQEETVKANEPKATPVAATKLESAKIPKVVEAQDKAQSKPDVAKVSVEKSVSKPIQPEPKPVLQIKEVKLTPKQLAAKFYKQAVQAQEDGELNSAIELFTKVLDLNSAFHQAREKLAALLYGKQQYSEAMQLLGDGINKYPKYSMFALLLAKVQYQVKQPIEALYSLEKIPNSSELSTQKWVQIGRIAQQQKQYSRAVEAYKQLTHIEPNQSRWWLGLAFNLDSQAEYAQASNAYKQALLSSNLSPASENYVQQRLQQLAAHSLASKKDGSAQ